VIHLPQCCHILLDAVLTVLQFAGVSNWGSICTVAVIPAASTTPSGTSSMWTRTGIRCARRTQVKIGLTLASPPMLAAARAAATAEGVVVEWHEGSAVELPFADAAFDVVLCQHGLQFFPDKPGALRDMNRVLRPGRRLVLSVWGPLERSPGFAVLAEALTRHVNPTVGGLIASGPFDLGDAEELRALIGGADFKDITVRRAVKTLRYPSPDEFVLGYVASSALASAVGDADERARASVLAEVGAKLASAVDDRGLGFPIATNIAIARC
jgi:ubiquinone/menaquinone biosynthesis C-methylase UbiE